jgi:hypothetical protein
MGNNFLGVMGEIWRCRIVVAAVILRRLSCSQAFQSPYGRSRTPQRVNDERERPSVSDAILIRLEKGSEFALLAGRSFFDVCDARRTRSGAQKGAESRFARATFVVRRHVVERLSIHIATGTWRYTAFYEWSHLAGNNPTIICSWTLVVSYTAKLLGTTTKRSVKSRLCVLVCLCCLAHFIATSKLTGDGMSRRWSARQERTCCLRC